MHDEAGVDGQLAVVPVVAGLGHAVGVGVAAEPVVGLEEGDVGRAGGDVRRDQAGDAGADDGDPAGGVGHHACLKANEATWALLGSVGSSSASSTVIPAPLAVAASPLRTTVLSSPAGMMPAGTNTSSCCSQSA